MIFKIISFDRRQNNAIGNSSAKLEVNRRERNKTASDLEDQQQIQAQAMNFDRNHLKTFKSFLIIRAFSGFKYPLPQSFSEITLYTLQLINGGNGRKTINLRTVRYNRLNIKLKEPYVNGGGSDTKNSKQQIYNLKAFLAKQQNMLFKIQFVINNNPEVPFKGLSSN